MAKTTILIVEDEAIVARDIAHKLDGLGYEICGIADQGPRALAMAGELHPSLVLMDIQLKGPMDGVKAAAHIRRECGSPVIFVTSHSDPVTIDRVKTTDSFGYILKPFEERELRAQIEMALYKHQTEQTLRRQSEWLRVTLGSIGDAVIATDLAGVITFVNAAASALTGWQPEEAVGQPMSNVFRIINEQTGRTAEDIVARVLRDNRPVTLSNHFALIARDGRTISIEDSAAPITNPNGRVEGVVVVFHDLTERKRAEKERIILTSLESTGILAGGIAHDFNNLLNSILLNLDLIGMDARSGRDISQFLEAARASAFAAHDLTKQLLAFSKGGAPVRKPVRLTEAIRAAAMVSLSGANVRGELDIDPDLQWTNVDEGQIGQVLRNLMLNARDAMPQGGVIRVRARNAVAGSEIPRSLTPGNYVLLEVIDHGVGIPPEVLPRIFDPYFSTKPRGATKGMGLGLTICHTIVRQHGGDIAVESQPGSATVFRVHLPACDPPQSFAAPSAAATAPSRLSKKILVMDDEDCMRMAIRCVLEGRGFQVSAARDGAEAINLYVKAKNQGRPFDAAILDLTIRGGMGAREAITALLKIDPNIRSIVMSGYSDDPVLAHPRRYGFTAAMEKSFNAEKLTGMLAGVLNKE